jgi:Sulfatase-modifying factor enzyme 1
MCPGIVGVETHYVSELRWVKNDKLTFKYQLPSFKNGSLWKSELSQLSSLSDGTIAFSFEDKIRVIKKPGYPLNSHIPFRMSFEKIAPGSFMMGAPATEVGRKTDEGPQHHVIISKAFEMQTTEVTQFQWHQLMGSNPSYLKAVENCPGEFAIIKDTPMCPNNPIEQVSWDDAQTFISKLNAQGDGYQYRLRPKQNGSMLHALARRDHIPEILLLWAGMSLILAACPTV